MDKQKFNHGDHVMIAKDLGRGRDHFTNDCEAIVIGSYRDKFGGDNTDSYTIYIKGHDEHSWYYTADLTLIKDGQQALLEEWKAAAKVKATREGDLDWIFENGEEVLKGASGATISALADGFGFKNLWGSRGEGMTYFMNARAILQASEKYLRAGDLPGWKVASAKHKEATAA